MLNWVKPYNLDAAASVKPIAVVRPSTKEDVSGFVKCAHDNGAKVQAKSGGHSYANYGLGGPGETNTVSIDMVNFQGFSMDTTTWRATVGAGTQLGGIDQKLHDNGGRAMSHGICPGVGLGGHATIGGLGASSRMWGSSLDHVVEVEVVVADGTITYASEKENPDLFFALKGAGASFGVITNFAVRTQPEPTTVTQYSYTFSFGDAARLTAVFKQWQDVISNPNLDRRFGSQIIMSALGIIVQGTFHGTDAEFQATGIPQSLPQGGIQNIVFDNWLGALAHQAEAEALHLSNLHSPFYSKSLGFRQQDLLTEAGIRTMMDHLKNANAGTLAWAVIFDLEAGAINDVPMNATAYPHRDKTMFYQSYAVGIPQISQTTRDWVTNLHEGILKSVGRPQNEWTVYAGYVDPALGPEAQPLYWGSNYPALRDIKKRWDPKEVFKNPQSVRPAA